MGIFKFFYKGEPSSEINPVTAPLLHTADAETKQNDQGPASTRTGQQPSTGHLPEDWKGLPVWLATEDPTKVEATLIGIRDKFMSAGHSSHPDQVTSSSGSTSSGGGGSSSSSSQQDQTVAAAATNKHNVKPAASTTDQDEVLQAAVLREAVMYGEMVQAAYDTLLTKDVYSMYFGNCVKGVMDPGQSLGDPDVGTYTQLGKDARQYKVLTRIEADSGAYKLVVKKARNYVGFIAEGPPDKTGAVDIAIVFRGTVTDGDWLQDAKALRVRWRGGEQPAAPPSLFLTASPFYSHFSIALITSIIAFVLLSSKYTSSILDAMGHGLLSLRRWCLDLGHPLPQLCLPITTWAWLLTGGVALATLCAMSMWKPSIRADLGAVMAGVVALATKPFKFIWRLCARTDREEVKPQPPSKAAVVGLTMYLLAGIPLYPRLLVDVFGLMLKPFMFVFTRIIDREEVNPQLLSEAAVLGLTAYLLAGIILSLLDKPSEWGSNAWNLLMAGFQWLSHGLYIFVVDPCVPPWTDPKVSYGFKEMYCDSLFYGEDNKEPPPSPRQTIFKTLAAVLNDEEHPNKRIKSITITGHSLGGALASMCGFDLSTTITEACGNLSVATAGARYPSPFVDYKPSLLHRFFNFTSKIMDKLHTKGMTKLRALYKGAHDERLAFQHLLHEHKQQPVVAVVTFAAPRVGNMDYIKALGPRTVMNPLSVSREFAPRDWAPQLVKMPWHGIAKLQGLLAKPWDWTMELVLGRPSGSGADAKVGMLRLVNAHDLVPMLPPALPVPGVFYTHGGYELLLNSYLVTYFNNSWKGQTAAACHSLEVYLHLLDNTRDIALVNKSMSVLTNDVEPRIPEGWWDPVPHKGLEKTADGKWRRNDALVRHNTPPPSLHRA